MTQEQENRIFERMLSKHGAYGLEAKIQKLEITRRYYRRWPYDGWSSRTGLDSVDLVHPSNPLNEIIAEETRTELLDGLTDRERWVANRAEEGYKPRDMAALQGKDSSGAERWLKHSVKLKMTTKKDGQLIE